MPVQSGTPAPTEDERWSAWMAAAQDGDLASYEQLLAELQTALRGFLRRMLGPADLVDECLQECLFAIHKARHSYDPGRPFKPWVYALANHKTIDVLRRRGTRTRYETPEDAAPEADAPPPSHETGLDVGRALERLDASQREAVLLTKLAGYTVDEAAARAGVTKTAMRSRLHRGIRQLRRVLELEPR